MGRTARAVACAALAVLAAGCGDPFVVIGDAPGVVRVVIGVPTVSGDSVAPVASQSELSSPQGLAVDANGVLYVGDRGNVRIVSVTPGDEIEVLLDHERRGAEPRLREVAGLALDGAGRLLIADTESQRIFAFDLGDGSFQTVAGSGIRGVAPDTVDALQADLRDPTGVAVDAAGRIYFSERGGHVIRRLEPDGRLIRFCGVGGLGGFSGDGGPAEEADLRRPAGIAVADGQLYIADSGNHRVRAVNLETGVIRTVAGSGGRGFGGDGEVAIDALLDEPEAVAAADGNPTLFIVDTGNHRIRTVNLNTNRIDTFAGTGDTDFTGDLVSAGEVGLNSPLGARLSPFGILFIADTGHHIVLRTTIGFLNAG